MIVGCSYLGQCRGFFVGEKCTGGICGEDTYLFLVYNRLISALHGDVQRKVQFGGFMAVLQETRLRQIYVLIGFGPWVRRPIDIDPLMWRKPVILVRMRRVASGFSGAGVRPDCSQQQSSCTRHVVELTRPRLMQPEVT